MQTVPMSLVRTYISAARTHAATPAEKAAVVEATKLADQDPPVDKKALRKLARSPRSQRLPEHQLSGDPVLTEVKNWRELIFDQIRIALCSRRKSMQKKSA